MSGDGAVLTKGIVYRDTSDAPAQITNREGIVLLRKGETATPCEWQLA